MKKETSTVKNVNRNLPDAFAGFDEIKESKKSKTPTATREVLDDLALTEKELKAQLKAIAKKVDTSKEMRKQAAAEAWKAKQKAKRAELKAAKALEKTPIVETMLVPVKNSDDKKVDSTVVPVNSSDIYCLLKVIRDDGITFKVVRKDNVWYLISQSKNVFGINIDIISEHSDSGLASRALAKKLHDSSVFNI